jgi:hypothetical protein
MSLSEDATREIATAEDELLKVGASVKKALSTLAAAKSKAAKSPWPIRDLRKFLLDLSPLQNPATEGTLARLAQKLNQRLNAADAEFQRAFLADLSREAELLQIPFGVAAGSHFLGPFELRIDYSKEAAELYYAKQPACEPQPVDAHKLSQTASTISATLLDPTRDIPGLFSDFEQAHRVALVRERRPIDGRETRTILPELFRELQFIRQGQSRKGGSELISTYSLPRFVFELKSLVQSDSNMESSKRFRLETAVIENTNNAKKSVFIPADLKVGYGAGTYFQALILVNDGR